MSHVSVAFMKAGNHVCSTVPVEVPDNLSIQEGVDPPQNCGMFKILTAEDGDKRVVWNRLILEEIRAAKKMFRCIDEFAKENPDATLEEIREYFSNLAAMRTQ